MIAESAKLIVEEIKANGGKVVIHDRNIANQQEVLASFKQIGAIGLMVNKVSIAHVGKAQNTAKTDFDYIINVNIKKCIIVCMQLLNMLYSIMKWVEKQGKFRIMIGASSKVIRVRYIITVVD